MSKPFETLAQLDKLVHEPARLAILTALSACRRADFLYLQRLTGLTKGNLSSHLARLDDADLVAVTKTFEGKKPITYAALTDAGRRRHRAVLGPPRRRAGRRTAVERAVVTGAR